MTNHERPPGLHHRRCPQSEQRELDTAMPKPPLREVYRESKLTFPANYITGPFYMSGLPLPPVNR